MPKFPRTMGGFYEDLGNGLSFHVGVIYHEGHMLRNPSGYSSFVSFEARFSKEGESADYKTSSNLIDIIKFYNESIEKYKK